MKKTLLLLAALSFLASNAQCWQQIDAAGYYTMGIKEDGTLWGWGHNWSGELGPIATDYHATPVQIGTDYNWAVVSAGNGHNMALKKDGTLWAWGRNDSGQVGNGIITIYPNPTPIQIGTDTDWAFICAGHLHSTAIKTNGTLWTWGCNYDGELGNGTVDVQEDVPQTIVPTQAGTDTDWESISASWITNAAIKTNGTLWEWGDNAYVALSNGATDDVPSPIQVGTDTDWATVSQGGFATTAIKDDGSLWSWGFNFSGGVGDGTNTDSTQPVLISSDRWRSVNRGMNYFTGAIKDDGTLWTWGYNYYGPLGDGTIANKNAPTAIDSSEQWVSYRGAGDFSVGLTADGELKVWGYNWYGELGFDLDGNTVLQPVTVQVCATAATEDMAIAGLSVYPNPVKDMLFLGNMGNSIVTSLAVYDTTGKTVLSQQGNISQLNVQQLPRGLYILHITTEQGSAHQKFIKE